MASPSRRTSPPLPEGIKGGKEKSRDPFQAELEQLQNELMPEVVSLTQHSDSGLVLVSKLYDCLKYLSRCHAAYLKMAEKKNPDNARAFAVMFKKLDRLKTALKKRIHLAAKHGLDNANAELKNKILKLNAKIFTFIDAPSKSQHLDHLSEINRWSTFFYYGTIVADYTTRGAQILFNFLPALLKNLSYLFPPIIFAVDAIKNIFDLIYSVCTKTHLSNVGEKIQAAVVSPLYLKGFYIRLFGNLGALVLNVFTILVFMGFLATTPVGWALSAGVVTLEWLANTIVPAWQAWKKYKNLENQRVACKPPLDRLDSTGQLDYTAQKGILWKRIRKAKENYQEKRDEVIYGFCSVAGSILLACVFFLPPLYMLAVILLIVSPAQYAIKFTLDYLDKKYRTASPRSPEKNRITSALSTPVIKRSLLRHPKGTAVKHKATPQRPAPSPLLPRGAFSFSLEPRRVLPTPATKHVSSSSHTKNSPSP